MSTAFVLSGGGSLGAIQVGMLLALAERGVAPDLLVGTSVGAVNAAWVAGRPGLDGARELAGIWRSVRRDDVFPARPLAGLLGFAGRRNHLVPPDNFRALLRRHLVVERLEDARIPVLVVTTDVRTGLEKVLREGDAVDAIAASAAIPGVFPPVEIDGTDLMDGGVANNVPISHAVAEGATSIYVLPTGFACALERPPRGALALALHAVTLLLQQRLADDVARYEGTVDLHVLPPLCPLAISPLDFQHTPSLIERAHASSAAFLDAGCHDDPLRFLALHHH